MFYHVVFAKCTSVGEHVEIRVFVDFRLDFGQLRQRCQDHGVAENLQQDIAVFQSPGRRPRAISVGVLRQRGRESEIRKKLQWAKKIHLVKEYSSSCSRGEPKMIIITVADLLTSNLAFM